MLILGGFGLELLGMYVRTSSTGTRDVEAPITPLSLLSSKGENDNSRSPGLGDLGTGDLCPKLERRDLKPQGDGLRGRNCSTVVAEEILLKERLLFPFALLIRLSAAICLA